MPPTIREIISRFGENNGQGGLTAVAKALNLTPSTVHSWMIRNYVPVWRQEKLIQLAFERGVRLTAGDFPPKPKPEAKVAA